MKERKNEKKAAYTDIVKIGPDRNPPRASLLLTFRTYFGAKAPHLNSSAESVAFNAAGGHAFKALCNKGVALTSVARSSFA